MRDDAAIQTKKKRERDHTHCRHNCDDDDDDSDWKCSRFCGETKNIFKFQTHLSLFMSATQHRPSHASCLFLVSAVQASNCMTKHCVFF